MNHPDASLFEQHVTGGLKPAEEDALERHAVECRACSERLRREARLEVQLDDAFTRLGAIPGAGRPRRTKWLWSMLPLGLAASILCIVWLGSSSPRSEPPPRGHVGASASSNLLGSRIDAVALDGIDDRMNTVDDLQVPIEGARVAPVEARQ